MLNQFSRTQLLLGEDNMKRLADARLDVDKPRNLAKVVTVE